MITTLTKPVRTKPNKRFTPSLFPEIFDFKNPYFTDQLITYIGNKRRLLSFINSGINEVKKSLGKNKLVSLDGFSGSGAVARLLKYHSSELWVNDLEDYCETINNCYLANESAVDLKYLSFWMEWLNAHKLDKKIKPGFIERHYAPRNDLQVRPSERVFYTNRNARIIDNIRTLIDKKIETKWKDFFIAPLLVQASVHTNTSGVFKGFHKKNGIGHFGGRGENALSRIKGEITLESPIFSEVECKVIVKKLDINKLIKNQKIKEFDLVYYDPPYNQHPYGSNYFMLNLIARNHLGDIQDGVSGIAKNWNRSDYNKRQLAIVAMDDLIKNTPAKYVLVSYNDEGIIKYSEMKRILSNYGSLNILEKDYNTYRGSRNLGNRNLKVKEYLWILKKTK